MKNNTSFSKEKQLVHTKEQAKIALNILVQNSQGEDLELGLFRLRDQLNNPRLTELLDSYPDLIQKYELGKLLSGKIEIKDASRQDIKTAGLMSCILLLIHFYFAKDKDNLRRSENDELKHFDSIKYILNSITSEKCINELFILILSIVGIDYFEKYQEKIKDPDFVLKQTIGFDNDPEMDEHIDMMVWFALVRLFIEAIFIYYDSGFESKNVQL
ncbi:hypothetical protein EG359_10305 [Chryseobacterium joostei]|uniref:DUF4272 domain-containing protein n=1 Tax=Chryseobacterium joostei TaxID=112234 RepID=A0A1N7KJA9_9FLAO|nr:MULTISPECIES: hypothetical protein [Chryseobacterium]AZA77796.1 hypothetical protein EG347_09835 [Chryseobacterium sp. G0186]AZA99990.1 hypothetical protein EG359_10305 [Chryseobacterium joostei]SIS61711.1 hypothetical protein SAMN05421768_1144 [Chryseobacterium joostei]